MFGCRESPSKFPQSKRRKSSSFNWWIDGWIWWFGVTKFCWYVSLKDQNHFPLISEVVVYEVSTGERLRRLGRHKDTPLALGFSPSGEYLATWIQQQQVIFSRVPPFLVKSGGWLKGDVFIHWYRLDLYLYIYIQVYSLDFYLYKCEYRFCQQPKGVYNKWPPKAKRNLQ